MSDTPPDTGIIGTHIDPRIFNIHTYKPTDAIDGKEIILIGAEADEKPKRYNPPPADPKAKAEEA
jgi:hypothetical protein